MKKKELKKRIKDLEQLTDCLISDNVRLMMRLGDLPCYEEVKERFNYNNVEIPKFGTCTQEDAKGTILERTKEPESKEQNDKRREIYEAQKPIGFPKFKTEGPESESELKENELPERWAIKSNKDNIGEIDKYYSRQLKYSLYKDYVGEYFHSHNLSDDSLSVMNDDIDFAANFNSEEIKHGYAEITFDQFKEHVLKENTISLEIRKKYLTRNGKEMTCWEKTSTGRYECTNEGDTFYYEKDGTLPGISISWYIVSEVKE